MKKQQPETARVYTPAEAPNHPLAKQYGITERQFRRALQAGKINYARPGGLRVLFTSEDITEFILGSRSDAPAPVAEVEAEPTVQPRKRTARRRLHSTDSDR